MDARCRIELLGGLRITQGERVITRFRTQKTASLLAYLAYHLPQAHPREVLIEMLWPGVEPAPGRNRLRMALTFLRHPLEPPGVPAGAVLIADRTSVRLNPFAVTTDVSEFQTALRQAGGAESNDARTHHLAQALELYHGELLSGFYDDWVQTEQLRLAEQFLQAIRQVIACCMKADNLDGALHYALRAVSLDPLNEESLLDVIRLYAAADRPREALRQYRQLERLLREELGVIPSPAARQLAETLRREIGPEEADISDRGTRPPPKSKSPPLEAPPPTPNTEYPVLHLPMQFTRFFGREEEIALLTEMLSPHRLLPHLSRTRPSARGPAPCATRIPLRESTRLSETEKRDSDFIPSPHLITLTGPGGSGKTRLAIEVAGNLTADFPGGIWFVPLADLFDPLLIPGTIVEALRLPCSPNREPLDQVVEFLNRRNAPALLVLDNLEHLLSEEPRKEDGAEVVRALLERIPILTLLVTSRRLLDLEGERVFPVAPLPVPDADIPVFPYPDIQAESFEHPIPERRNTRTPEYLMQFAGVQLFVDRAQAIKPDFQVTKRNADAVSTLCDRLDGLPLAIELAAARANVLTPIQMLAQLQHRFDFLVGRQRDASDRHRTLRAAIDWSFRQLSPALQRFFARLSVFRGGWTVEAAEATCVEPMALDYTGILRDCSLIVALESGTIMRFRMLETLREYAESRLTPEEAAGVSRAHRDYFLELAEEADPQLEGPQQDHWFARLEGEHDNMRAALMSCRTDEGGADAGLRLSVGLFNFWIRRGYVVEGCAWLEAMLSRSETGSSLASLPRRRALNCAGHMMYRQGENTRSTALFEQSLALCTEAGDKRGMAHALLHLGSIAFRVHGDTERSSAQFDECLSLYREVGDKPGMASAQWNLVILVSRQGDLDRASVLCEETLSLFRELGDKGGESLALSTWGDVAFFQGDDERAISLYEESLALSSESGNKMCRAPILANLGFVSLRQKDYSKANRLFHEAETLFRAQGDTWCLASSLSALGLVARFRGEYARAKTYFRESLGIVRQLENIPEIANCLGNFVELARAQNHDKRSARLLGALETLQPGQRAAYVAAARAEIEKERFEPAWAEGRLMTLAQVIAYALEGDEM
ncbi:MAG: putative ATPase [Chthonomonadaceae bacterium]|nr:putative ATPase [Chthonomonadaceae bacterium]